MRDVFLAEIKANPYDECVKKIFADWLDEHDEPELADVYRNWDLQHHLFCEDYLKEFVEDLTKNHYFEVHTDKPLTYEKLLELVENYVLYGNECDFCFGRDTPDRRRARRHDRSVLQPGPGRHLLPCAPGRYLVEARRPVRHRRGQAPHRRGLRRLTVQVATPLGEALHLAERRGVWAELRFVGDGPLR